MASSAHGTLTANQVTTITVTPGPDGIEVINRSMSGAIWVRLDGRDPVPEAPGTFVVLGSRSFSPLKYGAVLNVRLFASEAKAYSIEAI